MKKQCSPLVEVPFEFELKQLPTNLQYVYLEAGQKFPVIVATDLAYEQKGQLLRLLKKHKKFISWKNF